MFVYITTCIANNKKYIGKYEGKDTDNYLGSGKLLRRAIKKYGVNNFVREILEHFDTKEEVRLAEKRYIKQYDAVNSKEFYNIATGGEGGNTFAGIVGDDRVKLVAKLKERRKGDKSSYRNMVSCKNLYTNERTIITTSEFLSSNIHVGIACKGVYITPFGNFSSTELMGKVVGIDYTSLIKKCKNNKKLIRRAHFQRLEATPYYNQLILFLGSTFERAGYDFIDIKDLIQKDLDFYKKLSILKE